MKLFKKLFSGTKPSFPASTVTAIEAAQKAAQSLAERNVSPEVLGQISPGFSRHVNYPGPGEGFPAGVIGRHLLEGHEDKIKKIANGIGLPKDKFDRYILPVIANFADYVQFLPASNGYHHSGPGGLLAHSLEVSALAVNTAQSTSFDHGGNPAKRTKRRERWYAASTFAGLLHDAGKPLTDVLVHDNEHTVFWSGTNNIHEWALENGVDLYFTTFNKGRGEKHKALSATLVERLIPIETRNWLVEGGHDLYHAMVEAINGLESKSILTGIVIKADSTSVELDLQKYNGDASGLAATGVLSSNVPGKFSQAARYLVDQGTWAANAPGARVWSTTQGIFIAWKSAVAEVVDYFDANRIKGTPRGPESLGGALLDYGVIEPNADGEIYWDVAPDILANPELGKVIRLKCVKIANFQTLYPFEVPPKPVAVVIGPEGNGVRYDPADGGVGISMTPAQGDASVSAPVGAMFSLDAPAPIFSAGPEATDKPVSSKPEAAVQAPAQSEPLKVSVTSPAKPTAKQNGPKGPRQKTASELGISLQAATPPSSGIEIGTSTDQAKDSGPSALEAISARISQQVEPGSGSGASKGAGHAEPAGRKSKKRKAKNAQQNGSTSNAKEPVPTAIPEVISAQPPVAEFANLSSISLDVFSDAQPEPMAPEGEWEDPFASVPRSMPEQVRSTEPPAQVAVEDVSKPLMPAPSVSPADEPEQALASGGDDDWLLDFDPEILAQAGLPRPAYVERQESRESAKKAEGQASADKQERIHIPSEFMFEDEPEIDGSNIVNVPSASPTGFAPPPASIQLQVRESAAPAEDAGLYEVDLSQFDLPAFADGVVSGAIHPIEPSSPPETTFHTSEKNVSSPAGPGREVPDRAESPAPRKGGNGYRPASGGGATPGISIGGSSSSEGQYKPEITFSQPTEQGSAAISIGPVARKGRESKPAPSSPPVLAVTKASSGRLRSISTPEEVRQAEEFLALSPELAEKLKHYVANLEDVQVVNWRPLFLFHSDGFTVEDIDQLDRKLWLWNDFQNDSTRIITCNRREGLIAAPYLAQILNYLSNGGFDITNYFPSSELSLLTLEQVAADVLQECTQFVQQGDSRIYTVRPRFLDKIAFKMDLTQQDLRRALIETHEVSKQRENLLIKVLSKGTVDE